MPEHTPAPTPSRAVYGFALFLSFKLFFVIYLVWALTPEHYFESIGVYLPQRHWAVTVPIFLLTVLTVFAFIIYPNLGVMMTPDIDDLRTIGDKIGTNKNNGGNLHFDEDFSGECSCKLKEKCYQGQYVCNEAKSVNKSIPALRDLDMWDVSKHLYLK